MKKIILFLLFTSVSFAQDLVTTTQDEYNYMKDGYYIAQKSGLDMKQGYTVEKLVKHDLTNYTFEYKKLIRISDGKCVGLLLKANSKAWSNEYHYAIPFNNSELLNDFISRIITLDKPMLDSYTLSSSLLLSTFTNIGLNN